MTTSGRQLQSTLSADGTLTLEVIEKAFPDPTGNQVLVRMEAAPINPSDLFLLSASADLANAEYSPGKLVARVHPPVVAAPPRRWRRAWPR